MRTLLNPCSKVSWEGGGISVLSMRSVQINIVLVSWSMWFIGVCRTKLEKAFLIDVRPFDIEPDSTSMLKIPNLMFVPSLCPFFLTLGMVKQNVNCLKLLVN